MAKPHGQRKETTKSCRPLVLPLWGRAEGRNCLPLCLCLHCLQRWAFDELIVLLWWAWEKWGLSIIRVPPPTIGCLLLFLLHNLGLTFSSKKGKQQIKEQKVPLRKYSYTLVYFRLLFLGHIFDNLHTIEHRPIVCLICSYGRHSIWSTTIIGSKCTKLLTDVAKLDMLKWNILFDYSKKRSGGDENSCWEQGAGISWQHVL